MNVCFLDDFKIVLQKHYITQYIIHLLDQFGPFVKIVLLVLDVCLDFSNFLKTVRRDRYNMKVADSLQKDVSGVFRKASCGENAFPNLVMLIHCVLYSLVERSTFLRLKCTCLRLLQYIIITFKKFKNIFPVLHVPGNIHGDG